MRYRWLTCAVALLVCAQAMPSAAQSPPEPHLTRQNSFAIPFHVDPDEPPAQATVEVQLYVSTDAGATWQLAGRAAPADKQFAFRAPSDGDFWFSLRSIDRAGNPRPPGPHAPGLRVLVDTEPPRFNFTAQRGEAGEIVAQWRAADPNLNPSTLKVEFLGPGDRQWTEVAVERPTVQRPVGRHAAAASPESEWTGSATWWPPLPVGTISIRASIADAAGNSTLTQAQVSLDDRTVSERTVARPPAADASAPLAARDAAGRAPQPWPATESNTPTERGTAAARPVAVPLHPPVAHRPDAAAEATGRVSDTELHGSPRGGPASDAARLDRQPASSDAARLDRQPASIAPDWDRSNLPPGEAVRFIQARQFHLAWDAAHGTAAPGRLWSTYDGGRTWRLVASDDRGQGSFVVALDEEGLYGLRVTRADDDQRPPLSPQPGGLPQLWIGVDRTPPQVELARVAARRSASAGELVIEWRASDPNLAPRPVTLLVSTRPDGGWSTIAAGLENTGRYAWQLEARLPETIYLRLEVRDEAGNVGAAETTAVLVNAGRGAN